MSKQPIKRRPMKLMVGLPCMDMVHTHFMQSVIGLTLPQDVLYDFAIGTIIFDARNHILYDAINRGADRILWLDSDMAFTSDLFVKLNNAMELTGADVVSGLYVTRKNPIEPVIYSRLDAEQKDGMMYIHRDVYKDYPENQVFEIAACGFGACLTKVDICKKVIETYGSPFSPLPGMGEDLSFCWHVREAGGLIVCDSSIKAYHIGNYQHRELNMTILYGSLNECLCHREISSKHILICFVTHALYINIHRINVRKYLFQNRKLCCSVRDEDILHVLFF